MRVFLLLCLVCWSSAFAEKKEGLKKKKGAEKLKSLPFFGGGIYSFHKGVSNNLLYVTNRVDSFFGNTKSLYVDNGTNLRVYQIFTKTEARSLDNELNFRLDLSLPNLEKFLKFTLEKKGEAEEQSTPHTEESLSTESERQDKDLRGKVSVLLQRVLDFDFKISAGMDLALPPVPFVEMRLNRTFVYKKWSLRTYANSFWNYEGGFGQSASIDLDRPLTQKLLFRFVNEATWLDDTDEILTSHGPSLFHELSDRRFISYNIRANFKSRPTFVIRNYTLSSVYRQKIIEDVVFYELTPKLAFSKERNFDSVASISLKFELIF